MNGNDQIENNETTDDKSDSGKSIKNLSNVKEYLKYISVFSAFPYGIAMVIKNIYSFYYSIQAEQFYGIPRKYFYENVLGDVNISIILVLLFILMLLSPIIIKKWLKSRLSLLGAVAYSAMISISILEMLLLTVIQILDSFKLDYINNSKPFGIGILIFIFCFTGLSFYMYIKLFTSGDSKLIDNTDIEKQEIQKTEKVHVIFAFIFTILLGAILLLFFLNIKLPSNTKSYEVVLEENNFKKIVVVDYKDFYILMDIKEIKKVKLANNEEGNKLIFKKYYYELKQKENNKIIYANFKQVEGQE
ncbi:hypothetical protein [Mogibacterium diversum]|uniref:hypothetical protein n=1 Tax=Mogibacterium diversum TaxID=114527 RepID=UPI0028D755D8|nr:hypothetical protein [Mogibacterium diversum]